MVLDILYWFAVDGSFTREIILFVGWAISSVPDAVIIAKKEQDKLSTHTALSNSYVVACTHTHTHTHTHTLIHVRTHTVVMWSWY